MERLKNLLNAINEVVSLELEEIELLSNEKLESFKKYARIDWDPEPIYFNMTALIITNPDDYSQIKLLEKLELSTRLEIPEYNYFVYVYRFHNNEFLSGLLRVEDQGISNTTTQLEEGE